MKVQNIKDIDKFFQVIDSCAGKVELVTGEGDRLNLKSKLSQYVSMANIFSDGTIAELEILAYEPEDITKLVNFMMESQAQKNEQQKSKLVLFNSHSTAYFYCSINGCFQFRIFIGNYCKLYCQQCDYSCSGTAIFGVLR